MKISLVLPGNTFHANFLSEQMEAMDKERCGLNVFREFKIPVIAFFQRADLWMKPWLKEEMAKTGSVEWGHAPFSHTLIPLMGNWRHEIEEREQGPVPVTFFSEFYVPKANQVPTDYTLILAGNSVLYSAVAEYWLKNQGDIVAETYPPGAHAIRFEGKIGVLMREEWFGPFLKAFFLFQRYPINGSHPEGRDCLAELIGVIRDIAEAPGDRVIVCPIDMEAPWIGGRFGAQTWRILFEEIARQGLTGTFASLSSNLERFAREATRTSRPHRELTKWANWEIQLKHMENLNAVVPHDDRQKMVKMIATGSDILAAWGIKLLETRGKVFLGAVGSDGKPTRVPITYNQSVIDVQLAAFRSLRTKDSFLSCLEQVETDDYFVRLARATAKRCNL